MNNSEIQSLRIGEVLNKRYKIVEEVKGGAIAQVYLVQLLPSVAEGEETPQGTAELPQTLVAKHYVEPTNPKLQRRTKKMFAQEIKCLQLLADHERIPKLYDYFAIAHQGYYIIQEYLPGLNLSSTLPLNRYSNKYWQEGEVWFFLYEMAQTLDFVHGKNIIHGDIKPSNILVQKEQQGFVLLDFGSVHKPKTMAPGQSLPEPPSDRPLGYGAPEFLAGYPCAASDLYGLGLIAVQALTGVEPAQWQLDPDRQTIPWQDCLPTHFQGKNPELFAIIDRLLAWNPSDRIPTARALWETLETLPHQPSSSVIWFTEKDWPGLAIPVSREALHPQEGQWQTETLALAAEAKKLFMGLNPMGAIAGKGNNSLPPSPSTPANAEDQGSSPDPAAAALVELLPELEPNTFKLGQFPWLVSLSLVTIIINGILISLGLESLASAKNISSDFERLLEANQAYQQGNLEQAIALANTVSRSSQAHPESQQLIQKWEQQWQREQAQFQRIKTAFDGKNWGEVVTLGQTLPENPHWYRQSFGLVDYARQQLESLGYGLLSQAYAAAAEQDFTTALVFLEQIPLESSYGEKVAPKLAEYRHKQNVRSQYYFQQAINHAQKREFLEAVAFLEKVAPNSDFGDRAQEKIVEYQRKHRIRMGLLSAQPSSPAPSETGQTVSFNPGERPQEIHVLWGT